jgi:hypothetical protein
MPRSRGSSSIPVLSATLGEVIARSAPDHGRALIGCAFNVRRPATGNWR